MDDPYREIQIEIDETNKKIDSCMDKLREIVRRCDELLGLESKDIE